MAPRGRRRRIHTEEGREGAGDSEGEEEARLAATSREDTTSGLQASDKEKPLGISLHEFPKELRLKGVKHPVEGWRLHGPGPTSASRLESTFEREELSEIWLALLSPIQRCRATRPF